VSSAYLPFYHDGAAALVEDGRIVAAAQEERFTRKKHDSSFPKNAIGYCLEEAGARLDELDNVVFYDKPFLKFERLMETYVALAPRGFRSFRMAIPLWLKEKLFQKSLLKRELKQFADGFDITSLLFCEHHLSHAASAFVFTGTGQPVMYLKRVNSRWNSGLDLG
jgi:carbamoyltransferase